MRVFSVVVQLVPGFSFEFVQLYIPLCFCCFAIFFFLEFSFKLSLKKGSKQIDHTDHYAREKRYGSLTQFILKQYSSLSRWWWWWYGHYYLGRKSAFVVTMMKMMMIIFWGESWSSLSRWWKWWWSLFGEKVGAQTALLPERSLHCNLLHLPSKQCHHHLRRCPRCLRHRRRRHHCCRRPHHYHHPPHPNIVVAQSRMYCNM